MQKMKFLIPFNIVCLGGGLYTLTKQGTVRRLKGIVLLGRSRKSLPITLALGVSTLTAGWVGINCALLGVSLNPMHMVRRHHESLNEEDNNSSQMINM